ncbi:unannotated protein [freshwater metagenome]|uniref:Unannotated protein n=1 Tax=freshwater metagenome TaxID=449393 RepID=A0A6J6WSD9_9ZZZZ
MGFDFPLNDEGFPSEPKLPFGRMSVFFWNSKPGA